MTKIDENIQTAQNLLSGIVERCYELEKENKMLHEEQGRLHRLWSKDTKHIAELEEENKNLKSDLEECECSMHFENDEVGYRKRECKKLKEELSKLKEKYGDIDY